MRYEITQRYPVFWDKFQMPNIYKLTDIGELCSSSIDYEQSANILCYQNTRQEDKKIKE